MARVKERGLPLLAAVTPHVAQSLAPTATRLGLTAAGAAPLLVPRAGTPVRPSRPCKVTRALGPELVRVAGDLFSAAFSLPRDAVARCIDVRITETASIETYIAWEDDEPISAVSVTPAGIWSGATPPEHRGKGMGRALLTQVINDFQVRGVERFFLIAAKPSQAPCASLGVETIADLSTWALGHSTLMQGQTLEPLAIHCAWV